MTFDVEGTEKAMQFLDDIARRMVIRFPITRDEAVGRINRHWRGLTFGDDDLIFHETADEWAMSIYYGHDSSWWLRDEGERVPLPYP